MSCTLIDFFRKSLDHLSLGLGIFILTLNICGDKSLNEIHGSLWELHFDALRRNPGTAPPQYIINIFCALFWTIWYHILALFNKAWVTKVQISIQTCIIYLKTLHHITSCLLLSFKRCFDVFSKSPITRLCRVHLFRSLTHLGDHINGHLCAFFALFVGTSLRCFSLASWKLTDI